MTNMTSALSSYRAKSANHTVLGSYHYWYLANWAYREALNVEKCSQRHNKRQQVTFLSTFIVIAPGWFSTLSCHSVWTFKVAHIENEMDSREFHFCTFHSHNSCCVCKYYNLRWVGNSWMYKLVVVVFLQIHVWRWCADWYVDWWECNMTSVTVTWHKIL